MKSLCNQDTLALEFLMIAYNKSPLFCSCNGNQSLAFQMFICISFFFFFQVCAIVGGTFTVAGILDSMIFTASELFKKAQLGKLS